jgi:hypothetical protein
MGNHRWWVLGLAALLAAAPAASAAGPPDALTRDAQALAAKIDQHLTAGWAKAKAKAAPLADDAEFLRRAYLDLAGRIPDVYTVRSFLDDKAPDKRQRLIERLLGDPKYVLHFSNVWRDLMIPEANASLQARFTLPTFETWLKQKLNDNVTYDQMVREILTFPIGDGRRGIEAAFVGGGSDANPLAFYLAKEVKAENLAASVARLFLGVRVECAQCHNHPFAEWKRDQFWSFAAFFAGIERQAQGDFAFPTREVLDRRQLTIPGTERVVQATFLDGTEPKWKEKTSARATLADWITAAENPYFARAAVNRMWFYFFGTGLIDPVDEMVGTDITASHPELLNELAKDFAAHQFDLKYLIRGITFSKAYQLTSAQTHKSQEDPRLFAKMALRGLTPEQLFESVAQATAFKDRSPANPYGAFIAGNNTPKADFLTKFANQSDKLVEAQRSILQALTLMNGKVVSDATSLEKSELLTGVLTSPFLDTTERKIETLYLATLSRRPKAKELERLVKYVETGGGGEDKEKSTEHALADVFWALLNSSEFCLNH